MRGAAKRVAGWLGALAALGIVFASYLKPDVMLAFATQLWACF